MKQSTGGPAFPTKLSVCRDTGDLMPHQFGSTDFCATGMSLRDYFAAKAMQSSLPVALAAGCASEASDALPIARAAYVMADAMLEAREAA